MSGELGSPVVVVTGASGFVGQVATRRLQEAGYVVRAVSRSDRPLPSGVIGAVVPPEATHAMRVAACRGARCFVHLAARVHQMGKAARTDDTAFVRDNAELSRRWYEAAADAGVARFVLVSSIKAAGEESVVPVSEDIEPSPQDAYGRSKLAAERAVQSEGRMLAVILRFPLVYGPGVRGNLLSLLRALRSGVPLPFAGIANRRSLLSVENAAAAIVATLRESVPPSLYHVADEVPVSTADIVRHMASGMGRRPRLFRVPAACWSLLGGYGRRLAGSLELDCRRIRQAAPDLAMIAPSEGLAATGRWFVQAGG